MNGHGPTYVKTIWEAGMGSVFTPHIGRSGGRAPTLRTVEDYQRIAARRAAFLFQATLRVHACNTLATLTFRDEPLCPDEIRRIWRNALRRSQPSLGDLFYAMVAEGGATKRPHLHVAAGQELIERLVSSWRVHGLADVESVPFTKLGRVSEYMSKDFANPDRLFSRRYTALRGSKPKVERFEVSSHEEGLELIAELSSCSLSVSDEKMLLPFGRLTKTLWTPC